MLTYLLVLNNEDILEVSKNQETVTQSQVDRLEKLVKEGVVGQYQLADLKGQLASDQINIINNKNALETAKINLCQLMNIPYSKDLQFDRDELKKPAGPYEQTAEQVYQQSLENFAQVKATDFRVKSYEKAVSVAKGNYYPTLSFGANLNSSTSSAALVSVPGTKTEIATGDYVKINSSQYDVLRQEQSYSYSKPAFGKQLNDNLGNYYGFNLQVPLFNNFRVRNQVRLAGLNLKYAEQENSNIKLLLRQNIEQAHLNMTTTYERYKALDDQVNNFEVSFHAAEIRFNNGVINSVEYLVVKNSLDRARVNLITSMYEYILRTKVLDYYQVKLVW
jgi:outer membrane protein